MGRYKVEAREKVYERFEEEGRKFIRANAYYSNTDFNKFNPKILGLGDIKLPSKEKDVISAVYDLSEFTQFCRQIDPQFVMPKFLNEFLEWLFKEIRTDLIYKKKSYKRGKILWAPLPFFAKFTGDGILLLWDMKNQSNIQMCNVLIMLDHIRVNYKQNFLEKIKNYIVDAPPTLRCGIAGGKVCSVGNGEDYVGPCINLASRLQNLSSLEFSFQKKCST